VLEAFYCHGAVREAEELMRRVYGAIRAAGSWTLPETLARQHLGIGSMCHGWSASPLIFFSERTLGVRPVQAGETSRVLIAPESATLGAAEGIVPHPRGPVRVRWRIEAGRLFIEARIPPGLEAEVRPQGRLGGLVREVSIQHMSS
ncbi:MAG: hypothetical protein N2322_07025, partial [Terrimicrobiaceae bacterium]|nr:hypothetical protein [Terrimicrobiaceae bacterium]